MQNSGLDSTKPSARKLESCSLEVIQRHSGNCRTLTEEVEDIVSSQKELQTCFELSRLKQ